MVSTLNKENKLLPGYLTLILTSEKSFQTSIFIDNLHWKHSQQLGGRGGKKGESLDPPMSSSMKLVRFSRRKEQLWVRLKHTVVEAPVHHSSSISHTNLRWRQKKDVKWSESTNVFQKHLPLCLYYLVKWLGSSVSYVFSLSVILKKIWFLFKNNKDISVISFFRKGYCFYRILQHPKAPCGFFRKMRVLFVSKLKTQWVGL